MSKPWPTVRLGEVLRRSEETIEPEADAEYREITVRLKEDRSHAHEIPLPPLPEQRRVSADDTACQVKSPPAGPGLPSRSGRPFFLFFEDENVRLIDDTGAFHGGLEFLGFQELRRVGGSVPLEEQAEVVRLPWICGPSRCGSRPANRSRSTTSWNT